MTPQAMLIWAVIMLLLCDWGCWLVCDCILADREE